MKLNIIVIGTNSVRKKIKAMFDDHHTVIAIAYKGECLEINPSTQLGI